MLSAWQRRAREEEEEEEEEEGEEEEEEEKEGGRRVDLGRSEAMLGAKVDTRLSKFGTFSKKPSGLLHESASTLTKHRACAVKLTPAAGRTHGRTHARTDAIITSELSTLTGTFENI